MRSRQVRLLHRLAGECFQWPDEPLFERLPLLGEAAGELPPAPRAAVLDLLAALADRGPVAAGQHYVELFDTKPGRCLHLTWYTDGDTRRRGGSLAGLKQTFRQHGFALAESELPDFLPVLLEFAALAEKPGQGLLGEFRPALVRLHEALSTEDAAYGGLLNAVLLTIPVPRKGVRAAQPTPLVEQVGVAPVLLGYPTTRPGVLR
ncbi:nitrate reductase delta subunit [Crossiella equi]|uniref:Nitrate reductase delta subunit n=1 Tax=Crossiella equi TaxID=130796 RepID=A0ABS5AQX4_9PSEU|nr:nitrate reductase molybdenum cofactor assembly chaperone [Crossiella equi]MBP2478973.1 nitrate reductase delta subunit [Crossiella equi]